MSIKIIEVQHLRSGTVLMFNDGTERVSLKVISCYSNHFFWIPHAQVICLNDHVLFARAVQLRIDGGMYYTNVIFTGWMKRNGMRWRVCQFDNGWQSWFLGSIIAFMLSCWHGCSCSQACGSIFVAQKFDDT